MKRVFLIVLTLSSLTACGPSGQGFDAEAFRRNQEPGWCALPVPPPFSFNCGSPRAGMWTQVRAALTPGMTRLEVLELLGPADGEQDQTLLYDMGMGSYGIDPDYLTIEFDAEDRLVRVSMTRG